jgi:hypothetical protein
MVLEQCFLLSHQEMNSEQLESERPTPNGSFSYFISPLMYSPQQHIISAPKESQTSRGNTQAGLTFVLLYVDIDGLCYTLLTTLEWEKTCIVGGKNLLFTISEIRLIPSGRLRFSHCLLRVRNGANTRAIDYICLIWLIAAIPQRSHENQP